MALAIVFESVGAGEWLVLLAVLLVVVGPKRLPSVIRSFGNHYAKFRRAAESFKRQIMEMDTEFERAVDDAAREAEAAASMPDISDPELSEPPETSETRDEPGFPDFPGCEDRSGPPEEPSGTASVASEAAAEAAGTDGDRVA